MADHPRSEVERHFRVWREAVDQRDLDQMARMFAEDARGGNSVFGLFEGRDAIAKFSRDHWPELVPNRSVWQVIDGDRVVNKWRETLPGDPPTGRDYHYDGISEFLYAGSGHWSFMYGLPDVIGLTRVYARWREDGQAELHGEVYPGFT